MLQGVCEIELRDEHGNVVQRTKDKNMITNGISAYLNTDYNLITTLLRNDDVIENFKRLSPVIQKLIGGVYLFNEVQDETESNIIPNPFSIVASGSLSKSTIADDRAGIWNVDESAIIYNDKGKVIGFKFVWDFLTAKGNGTIRSVSLTTDMGARSMLSYDCVGHYYIYNNSSSSYYGTKAPFNLINPIKEKETRSEIDYNYGNKSDSFFCINMKILCCIDNEIITFEGFDYTTKTITFKKYRTKNKISLNESVFDDSIKNSLELIGTYTIDISDLEITFSSDIKYGNGLYYMTNYYNGIIYIGNAYNNRIIIKKINVNNMEVIETINRNFELNNLNKFYYNSYNTRTIVPFFNYYVVMIRKENQDNITFLDNKDFTIVKEIEIGKNDGTINSMIGLRLPISFGYLEEMLYMSMEYYNKDYKPEYKSIVVDSNLNIIEKSAKKIFYNSLPIPCDLFKYPYLVTKGLNFSTTGISSGASDLLISANTKFTIDNLATPVTKTASQTMKVIYTIKDAE